MVQNRLKLSMILLLGMGLTQLQAQTMYVMIRNGTQTAYPLDNIQKISFSPGNIHLFKIAENSENFDLTDIRHLNFNYIYNDTTLVVQQNSVCKIRIFPNPVSDILNIDLTSSESKQIDLDILSLDGRVIYTNVLKQVAGVQPINVSAMTQGVYLLRIKSREYSESFKFLKN